MTVNHAGALKKEYFLSYLNLIKISRNCTIEQAKEIAIELFFHHNAEEYGSHTYKRFLDAFQELNVELLTPYRPSGLIEGGDS
ncbi:hypothetical protein [Neobacillus drentensis]|uniref:hypothetical protein n=1 Tax=Neobacillus drentensis TaxID=220684 RepID=UPI002FFD9DBE